jgi:tetratricopeptide (TPR) repeat protein
VKPGITPSATLACRTHHIRKRLRISALVLGYLCMWAVCAVTADTLSELPAAWAGKLHNVPATDLSGIERIAREAIQQTRARLAAALTDPASETDYLAEGFGKLGALYRLVEINSAASLSWENASLLQPAEFRWTYYRAHLAQHSSQNQKALELYQAATALDPNYPPLNLRLGEVQLESNRLEEARTAFTRAAREPGLRPAALYYLGQIAVLERSYQAAVDYLEEALQLNPDATEAHHPLAQAYRQLGEVDSARRHLALFKPHRPTADDPLLDELDRVIRESRTDFALAMRAVMEERDYESAIRSFARGLEIDPENVHARVSYARALYLAGQTDAAERELVKARELAPEHVLANFLLGVLRQHQGHKAEAADYYRRLVELDPSHEGAQFYLGNLAFEQGRFDEAVGYYDAALRAVQDIPPAHLLRIVASHHAGAPDRELAGQLESLLTLYPDQIAPKYALIRMRALSEDPGVRDSAASLDLANQLAPSYPTPANVEALALAAAADGQFEAAERVQRQAIGLAGWMAPKERLRAMEDTLAAYAKKKMPAQAIWPIDDPVLSPPRLNPTEPFRDYPAAAPF